MIRLVPDQSAHIRRTPQVAFTFDGAQVTGHAGETLAAALLRSGQLHLRDAPNDHAPRGAFCVMGLCQECLVVVDGVNVEACKTLVEADMVVTSLKVPGDA